MSNVKQGEVLRPPGPMDMGRGISADHRACSVCQEGTKAVFNYKRKDASEWTYAMLCARCWRGILALPADPEAALHSLVLDPKKGIDQFVAPCNNALQHSLKGCQCYAQVAG